MRGTVFASGLLCAGCGLGFSDPERIVPDGASGMISLDVPKLADPDLRHFVETNLDDAKIDMLWTLREQCGLDARKLRAVVFAYDDGTDSQMVVVQGPGLGDEELVACATHVLDEDDPVSFSEEEGLRVFAGEDRQGWIVDEDTVVMCSKAWSPLVEARVHGRGKAAVDHSLLEATKAVDTRAAAWGVMTTGPNPGVFGLAIFTAWAGLVGFGESLEFVTGSMALRGNETHLAMSLHMSDEESADTVAARGSKKLAASKATLASSGVPIDFLDSIEIEASSSLVRIEGHAATTELFATTHNN